MKRRLDQEMFKAIYHATFSELSKFVYFRVKRLEDAQDIVQHVYMDYYQHVFLKDKQPQNVQGYLKQMASHMISKYYQHEQWTISNTELTEELIDNIPSEHDVESDVFEKFTHQHLWKTVRKLDPMEEKIIIAKFRFDMTFKEIAQTLSLSENTIKTKYYRALDKLKNMLEDETF